MAEVWVKKLSGSDGKNVHIQVSGFIEKDLIDWRVLVKSTEFNAKGFRLDAVNYALSDKIEVLLAWDTDAKGNDPHVFLPLNGRGRLDFDSVNGLQNTVESGKTGNVLIHVSSTALTIRRCHFTLALDFSKQGA